MKVPRVCWEAQERTEMTAKGQEMTANHRVAWCWLGRKSMEFKESKESMECRIPAAGSQSAGRVSAAEQYDLVGARPET